MTTEEELSHLPAVPGVYYFQDKKGEVIYVGKAVSLRNRVRSYYQSGAQRSPKVRSLMDRATDLKYIVTDSEVEALILESNLIKEHRPRYNVVLKDDKSYPYLRITLGEEFPRIHITRRLVQDGSLYFGPYTQVGAVQETLNLLRKLFPFRTCKQKIAKAVKNETGQAIKTRQRPCLNHHLRRCLAPCCGLVSRQDYRVVIQEICLFLEGRQEDLLKRLTLRMEESAQKLEFEKAAQLRDQIKAIQRVIEKQKVVLKDRSNQDIIAAVQGKEIFCAMVFYVRSGKLIGREHFLLPNTEGMSSAEVITAFIKQYYHRVEFVPEKILLSEIVSEEKEVIARWLAQKKGSQVSLHVPFRGEKKKMIEMVKKNAWLSLQEAETEHLKLQGGEQQLCELARELDLEKIPGRLECFDVSNIQGFESVASMVVFEKGRICPDQYRRFKIRTVEGPNDYASLQEVLRRRFARAREEQRLINSGQLSGSGAGFHRLPDLVIVDGGKGQLSAAREVMREMGFENIPACGLAKEEELLFIEGKSEPVRLPGNSPVLHLVQRLRDEAHRFALAYHRKLRTRHNLKSLLDEIEGIGDVRRQALLKAFTSLEAISRASVEELAAVPGMNLPAAKAVYGFFH